MPRPRPPHKHGNPASQPGRTAVARASWRGPVGGFALVALLALGVIVSSRWLIGPSGTADASDPVQVALGERVYAAYCGSCHGAALEGQPNWRQRLPTGRLPAPPHDATGHTWHHPDALLFRITRDGPAAYGSAPYPSDMPAFDDILSDEEIWAVLAFIKSRWPEDIRQRQENMKAALR